MTPSQPLITIGIDHLAPLPPVAETYSTRSAEPVVFCQGKSSVSSLKRCLMKDSSMPNCEADDTQQITIQLPCRLAERAEKYASKSGNTITGVVIEALDTFLRGRSLE